MVGAQNLEIHCNCILKLFRKVSTHKIYCHTEWCPKVHASVEL